MYDHRFYYDSTEASSDESDATGSYDCLISQIDYSSADDEPDEAVAGRFSREGQKAQHNTKSNMPESNLQNDFFSAFVIVYLYVLQNLFCKAWWKSGIQLRDPQDHPRPLEPLGLSGTPWDSLDSLGPSRSLLISGTTWNPWVPENLPETTGIPRDMVLEKDFSGIAISFLYLRNYNFFNYKNFSIQHF